MKRLILATLVASTTGCGVIFPDVMIVGTEQGIRAYNDGQSALIAQSKTQSRNGETPYWNNRKIQSRYSFWDRLSKGFVNTVEKDNEQ
jgi:hypothetical protein